jgi:uncharacterized NAD-dependent epimerase/dehydratase family protein
VTGSTRAVFVPLTLYFEESAERVPTLSRIPSVRPDALTGSAGLPIEQVARVMGLARMAIGGPLLIAPGPAVRLLGMDSATAKRTTFLTRMAAARDVGLGVGTLLARDTDQVGLWLAVGAAADAVDAVAILAAARAGVVNRVTGGLSVAIAAGGAAFGGWAAVRALRGRR